MSLNVRYLRKFVIGFMCLSLVVIPVASQGAELKKETQQAWDAYIQTANSQMVGRTHGSFLWVDEVPDRSHSVHEGKIVVSQIGQQNPQPVPFGLIHDWIGAAFIPNARLEDVLSAARDYGHYKEFYKPNVIDSKSLGTAGACDKYVMLMANHEIIASTALEGEYEACYHQLDNRRWYSIAHTTRVQEIRRYAQLGAQPLPSDQGSGYIWRIYSFARFEERDGGVYVELEAIVLSRDIPVAVRWLVSPIVRRVSKNAMTTSLRQMEEAVRLRAETANRTTKLITVAALSSKEPTAGQDRSDFALPIFPPGLYPQEPSKRPSGGDCFALDQSIRRIGR